MSIFPTKQIEAGDMVIGKRRLSFGKNGSLGSIRYFEKPSLVLEIKNSKALIFFEQDGPAWYNLSELELCYVTEEYTHGELAKD